MELKLLDRNGNPTAKNLLIVPYGIETIKRGSEFVANEAFNRTLWN